MVNWVEVEDKGMLPSNFFDEMIKEFPKLKDEIDMWGDDDVFNRMEEFSYLLNAEIEKWDEEQIRRCFEFIEHRIEKVNDLLLNALNVSFLETVYSENDLSTLSKLVDIMPLKVRKFYKDNEQCYSEMFDKAV